MAKYSFELKLQAVLAYLKGKESIRAVAKLFNVNKTPLENWIAQYRENGEQGLISSYTNYDIQFKMDVLNYMSESGEYCGYIEPDVRRCKPLFADD